MVKNLLKAPIPIAVQFYIHKLTDNQCDIFSHISKRLSVKKFIDFQFWTPFASSNKLKANDLWVKSPIWPKRIVNLHSAHFFEQPSFIHTIMISFEK